MNQTVTKIPMKVYTQEEQTIIRAIPDLQYDRNNLSKRMIYECAKRQMEAFRASRISWFRPQSYIEPILDDLCRRAMRYRDKENAYQVLYAMCMILRKRTPMFNNDCCFADNIQEFLSDKEDFRECEWDICSQDLRSEDESGIEAERAVMKDFSRKPTLGSQCVYICVQGDYIAGNKYIENENEVSINN